LFGAVQEDAQVIAVDAKVAANGILVALFEENFAEKPAVALGHLLEDLPNLLCHLLVGDSAQHVDVGGGKVPFFVVVEGIVPGVCPVVLEQNVVAHGVHESTEAVGLADLSVTQGDEYAGECFLAYVLNRLRGIQARAELELNQLAEVGDEVFLRSEVSRLQALNIGFVKGLELQGPPLADGEVPASVAPPNEQKSSISGACNETGENGTIFMKAMRLHHTVRGRSMTFARSLHTKRPASGLEKPGLFQCTILRALELPKAHREVFLLKDIQGHTFTEIAAILGISIETARVRLKRARREIGHLGDSGAMGREQ
jgi:predicted DNA-binding protein (UPF0251 family)